MTEHHAPADLEALHGQTVTVEQVDLVEDADGIPAWIDVEHEMATVVIVPSLLQPPVRHVDTAPRPEQVTPS